MQREFSVFEALATGTQRAFDNFRLFFLAGLTFIGLSAACVFGIALFVFMISGVSWHELQNVPVSEQGLSALHPLVANVASYAVYFIVFALIALIIFTGLGLGYNKMALEVYDRGTSTVSKLFSCFRFVPTALIAGLLYALMVFLGTLLFVLPGIYIALRCAFFVYFIFDKNAGIVESLKLSYAVTAGHIWQIFALYIILSSVTLVLPIMGLFIMPISTCVWSYVYRVLTTQDVRVSV